MLRPRVIVVHAGIDWAPVDAVQAAVAAGPVAAASRIVYASADEAALEGARAQHGEALHYLHLPASRAALRGLFGLVTDDD